MHQDDNRKRNRTTDEPANESRYRNQPRSDEPALVRLTRKYADMIDGVDLEDAAVGDRLMLSRRDADVLIAEGWAEPVEDRRRRQLRGRAHAADRDRRRTDRKPKT